MPNIAVKGAKTLAKGAVKVAKELIGKEILEKTVSVGTDAIEKYNNRKKIPDLKDVPIEDAIKNLNDLDLIPITAIAKPNVGYVDSHENVVVNSEPKFGKKVDPKTTVKLYYVTNDTLAKCNEMEKSLDEIFKLPRVVGLDIYEAREDLEELGLRVTLKLEYPNIQHHNREDGQVTRVRYPDDKKLTRRQKKGERVWLYYVDENIIKESVDLKGDKIKKANEWKEKMSKFGNDIPKPFKNKK